MKFYKLDNTPKNVIHSSMAFAEETDKLQKKIPFSLLLGDKHQGWFIDFVKKSIPKKLTEALYVNHFS